MAYLIGSSSISAYTTNTAIANNNNYANYCGTAALSVTPNASGTATKLNLYIAGYTTIANIKVVLYENGTQLSQATYNLAAIGNGFVTLNFPSTAINVANKYRLAFYMDTAGTLNLWTKAGGLDLRRETIGTYAAPSATIGDGTYRSNNEFYWSLETAPAYSIDSIDSDNILEPGQTFTINTTGFTGQPVATTNNADITVTITGGSGNVWTATINDRTDGASYPLLPLAGVTLTLTNGAETANRLFTVTQKTTEKYITFLSANTTDGTYISYLFAQLGYTVEGAGLHYIPPAGGTDLVITHDGTVSVKSPGIIKCWFRPVTGTGAGKVFYYDVSTVLLMDSVTAYNVGGAYGLTNKVLPLVAHELTNELGNTDGLGLFAWRKPANKIVTQQFPLAVVNPRPDSETGTYGGTVRARHRWAYYDGTNNIQYEVPVKVQGGAGPHIYELIRGPSGATVGNTRTAADHGIVKWTPTRAYPTSSPASFLVRVYSADMSGYIDVSWSCATSSSTAQFIFINNSTGSDSNSGSISSPFQTLAKVTGSTMTTATYPNRIVYLRGTGTDYTSAPHSDHPKKGNTYDGTDKYRCILAAAYQPCVYLTYPGENVRIDFSAAEFKITSSDTLFSGSSTSTLTIYSSATLAYESHNFWWEYVPRIGMQWVTFDGFVPRDRLGLKDWTNFAPIFGPYSASNEASITRRHCYLHCVNEINRTTAIANDGLLFVMFGSSYVVVEYCTAIRTTFGANAGCVHFKDGNWNTSVRYCDFGSTSSSYNFGFSFSCQTSGGNNEIVYSKVRGNLWFNYQNSTGTVGRQYAGRCTVYTLNTDYGGHGILAWKKVGASFNAENCIVVSNGPLMVTTAISSPANGFIVNLGTECQKTATSGDVPISTTDLTIKNATTLYKDLYDDKRGWEIR